MPKKVLYLENAIGWGGSAICLKLIAGQLNKNKYYPIITTPHYDSNYKTYKDVAEWHHIPDKRVGKQQIADKINRFFKRIGITNKRCGESIASLFDYIVNLIPYVLKVYCLAKRKQVNIIHLNNEPVCNMAGVMVARFMKIACISHVRGPVSWNSSTSRWLYKKVDYFITVAEWIKKDVMKMGISSSKIQTIMDGRKLNEFNRFFNINKIRSSLGLNDGELSVGMIGRLNPWKGHRVFIEASQAVEKIFPDCRIFIIGGASDKYKEYEAELKQIVAEKGIKNLFFTGQRNDIPDVLRVLDVIVHASVEPDPYPNVVLETMAAGRPVIATNIGGPIEMIEDYKTGILIPPNKPGILADKICELLSDKSLRQSLGTEAKKIAFERYSIEEHVRDIERVYEKVLPDRIN